MQIHRSAAVNQGASILRRKQQTPRTLIDLSLQIHRHHSFANNQQQKNAAKLSWNFSVTLSGPHSGYDGCCCAPPV